MSICKLLAILAMTTTLAAQSQPLHLPQHESGSQDQIKVHGHWTIVVRNSDGSVSLRREFENGFTGNAFVASLLAGKITQFNWVLMIGPICGTQSSVPCYLGESALANDPIAVHFFDTHFVPSLTVSAPTTGPNAGKLVLAGSATAAFAGQTTTVSTGLFVPAGNVNNGYGFSYAVLPQAINVQAGQVVNVTVVFSYS